MFVLELNPLWKLALAVTGEGGYEARRGFEAKKDIVVQGWIIH